MRSLQYSTDESLNRSEDELSDHASHHVADMVSG